MSVTTNIVNIFATSRENLVHIIDAHVTKVKNDTGKAPDLVLRCSMTCGKNYDFKTIEDVPRETLECECGNETVIKYEE